MTTTELNPLLSLDEFVPYSRIKSEHILPAIKDAISQAEKILEDTVALLDSGEELTFENAMQSFIDMEELVEHVWTPVENLLSLQGEKDVRDAAEEARPLMVEFFNKYAMDERVYRLVKKYSQTEDAKNLDTEKKRYLDKSLRDFVLAGAELEGDEKQQFKDLNLKLSQLSQKFSNNVTDSKFNLIITDKKDLAGLPEDAMAMAKAMAQDLRKEDESIPEGAWVFNLDYPSYGPFMKFADNGELRKKLYFEYLNRAVSEGRDNRPLLKDIFDSKTAQSKLLGYKNYAEVSLETKMAKSPEEVKKFLVNLADQVKDLAQKEYAALVSFQKELGYKNTESNPDKVCPWDNSYLSEKLRKKEYDFDTNLLKQYFELENCIEGLFHVAAELFGIQFEAKQNSEIWHEDVRFYEVKDSNETIGYFYFDLHPRSVKRQGAWMMPLVQGAKMAAGYRKPQAVCSCNLTRATGGDPTLLNHIEVITLFHEFGHALHHLLTKVNLAPMAGTNVEWDFVELPSQLYENWVWEKESLKVFAKHYETGEPIPDDLLEKLLKSRVFNEGLSCVRQLEFALFDLNVYLKDSLSSYDEVLNLFKEICQKYGVFEFEEGTNFPTSFEHIFSGGYSSGYYSYKWAEVLEADAFSRFKEEGILNSELGKHYREAILAKGDSMDPYDLFVDFMGREPSEKALLERMGLGA